MTVIELLPVINGGTIKVSDSDWYTLFYGSAFDLPDEYYDKRVWRIEPRCDKKTGEKYIYILI